MNASPAPVLSVARAGTAGTRALTTPDRATSAPSFLAGAAPGQTPCPGIGGRHRQNSGSGSTPSSASNCRFVSSPPPNPPIPPSLSTTR